MIQSVMLVMLGFFLAALLATLLAPSLYKRAARLTARRIEATMPITRTEIEADKDQIRASYAVKVRRLESALARSKEKSASQLVEISRLHMAVAAIQDQAAEMERQLEERRNAAIVFEQTIRKRFPELELALTEAKAAIEEQNYEISDLRSKVLRRDEAVDAAERNLLLGQAELKQIREAMERGAVEQTGRFAKRPSQWSIEEYRAEYDRLNVELSRLREQLALIQDREAHQTAKLKSELQQLAQQIMTAAASQAELTRRNQGDGGGHGSERNQDSRVIERRPAAAAAAPAQPRRAPTWPKQRPAEPRPVAQGNAPHRAAAFVEVHAAPQSSVTAQSPSPAAPRVVAPAPAQGHGVGHGIGRDIDHGAASAESTASPASAHAAADHGEGEKTGDAGIRSLLDRLRDLPEPLAGA